MNLRNMMKDLESLIILKYKAGHKEIKEMQRFYGEKFRNSKKIAIFAHLF